MAKEELSSIYDYTLDELKEKLKNHHLEQNRFITGFIKIC